MADENIDYSQVFNFLYRIEKRVSYLEKDLLYVERKINSIENKRSENFMKLNSDIKKLHESISSLRGNFTQCTHYMALLGKDLKNCMKKEELESLNAAVDEIKFEEYVTRKNLKKELNIE